MQQCPAPAPNQEKGFREGAGDGAEVSVLFSSYEWEDLFFWNPILGFTLGTHGSCGLETAFSQKTSVFSSCTATRSSESVALESWSTFSNT